jgi:RHS repeat-associated protein
MHDLRNRDQLVLSMCRIGIGGSCNLAVDSSWRQHPSWRWWRHTGIVKCRLTQTEDTVPDPVNGTTCTTRTYTLDGDSNRTALASFPDDGADPDNGSCTTATSPVSWAGSYDEADRLTNTGYAYDSLGRTSTVPAADAVGSGSHAGTAGALAVGYYANDLVASQVQGGRTLGFTLDPAQDGVVDTTDTAGPTTSTNHYADSGDSPAWTSTNTGWTRNIAGIAGGLAATIDQTGTVTLQLANMHGDLVDTAADDPAATGPLGYTESTEYGAPRNPATAPDTYGWLGAKQRSTNDLAGLTLMGVRLYNPASGRFLSVDPVPGGNDNPYIYVNDPTDQYDLDGRCWRWCNHALHWTVSHRSAIASWAANGACVVSGPLGCAVAQGAAWAVRTQQRGYRNYRAAAMDGIWTAASYGNGQAFRFASRGTPEARNFWAETPRWQRYTVNTVKSLPSAAHTWGSMRRHWAW